MVVAVLGTGSVGRALAGRMAELGHEVRLGTRDPGATRTRAIAGGSEETFATWLGARPDVRLTTFAEAVAGSELVVNALRGEVTLDAFAALPEGSLDGVVLLDVANPLQAAPGGGPARLSVVNDDSLAEQLQRAHPTARVVKSLNTMNAALMVRPDLLAGGDHTVFVSGDDALAKATVVELLSAFGWSDVLDLGGLETARGTEMYLALWLRLYAAVGSARVNAKVVR